MAIVEEYVLKMRLMLRSRPHSEETEDKFIEELDILYHQLTEDQKWEAEKHIGGDSDLLKMDEEQLGDEVRKLRSGIRIHRDTPGGQTHQENQELWNLLPEKSS